MIGKSYPRRESLSKVTGRARYTNDLALPGMVYGMIYRSPYAHARVLRIDPSEAERIKGILHILLPGSVPSKRFNCAGNPPSPLLLKDETILTDHPLHVGDRIAAVAGLTAEACYKALGVLKVEFEPLPEVFEMDEALKPETPALHPDLPVTNRFKKMEVRKGDVEMGFEESDLIFEGEFRTSSVQHVAMEPVGCICDYGTEGTLTVWCNTQTPFQDRRLLAELLDLPESRVRVIKPAMGGGFGGRQQIHNQHVGALLSRAVKRPVKIINTREEEMVATTARHGSYSRVKVGVNRDGRLQAFHIRMFLNAGAYCTHSPIVLAAQTRKFQYRIPHYHYEGYGVYTNGPVAGAMRGYGNPQINFARERMMDRIAKKLNLDPLRFRMINHLDTGETIPGHTFPLRSCAITECVEGGEAIRRRIDENEKARRRGDGVTEAWGIAFACHTSGPSNNDGMSSCLILINDDGSVHLATGSSDIGQGCETTFCQIVSEELGIDMASITVSASDTLHVPYDLGTFASGQIYVGGNAVRLAAQDAKEKLRKALASHYDTDLEKVSGVAGGFRISTREGKDVSLSFREAVTTVSFGMKGTTLIGSSSFKAKESPLPFAVCWAKIAWNQNTNTVEVKHIIEAVDVGTPINPEVVRGQVEGGIGMGLGFALMEQIEVDSRASKPFSSDLLHYRIPTSLDMPGIHVYLAKGSYEPTGPFGAKSVGELPAVPVASAIANAISIATGIEIDTLPLGRDFVFRTPRSGGSSC